ncbi:lytic transglycosylase domain-containing protein [Streptomyces bambusae]|uniref:lytic transglycosylase domain-containing protein n=1 Tax=Streptomyces bambusae TaxID=1550616 RepID=UPI001CFD753F|nr:lytic transglycosylase domain-containing protein [Streptomyces bambusae]MCB5166538.1 lytic transglycosylase domain-containing protein [Streptomyces bambusae]
MRAKRGIVVLGAALAASPLALGVGLVLLLTTSKDGGDNDLGDYINSSGSLRVGKGFVPAKYAGLIEGAAAAYDENLPAGILAAQIEAESGFDPDAVSYEDPETKKRPIAFGIAQFIPDTWEPEGIDGDGDRNIWDPMDAIPSQGSMVCKLLKTAKKHPHYDGSPIELALAGYNAGWGAVERYKGVHPERFAEGQTYWYVQRSSTVRTT